MSNKIKTIEYSRFLSEEELSAVRGGRAFNKLSSFSCSPFELCSSTMVFTTCTVNYNIACAMYKITCGNPSLASYISCTMINNKMIFISSKTTYSHSTMHKELVFGLT